MKQSRGIRRIIVWAGIFLLLGAIVNIAVAWGCALQPRISESGFDTGLVVSLYRHRGVAWASARDHAEACAYAAAFRMWPLLNSQMSAEAYQELTVQHWERFGVSITSGFSDRRATENSESKRTWLQMYVAGWPMPSLAASVNRTASIVGGVSVPAECLQQDRANLYAHWEQPQIQPIAPLTPLWPGFAINTVFYAAILWLLFTSRFAFPRYRRMRRIKRGLCPACAYPVGTSDLCTECGMPVTARKVEPASP